MRFSKLFTKTTRENPKDELSANSQLLERAGFVYKNSAGIYSYLPLGWRVFQKIVAIVRDEMSSIGGQELYLPALLDRHYLDKTDRWNVDIGFEVRGKKEDEAHFVLGWTHEEVLTEIVSKFITSYKDLPFAAYQIQTKFRNEARAKSGLLRGREFMMKDLYSFHTDEKSLELFYDDVKKAYFSIFERCGLKAYYTLAAGGAFTINNTHEFQVICEAGEDLIFVCQKCDYAENSEISKLKDDDTCPGCGNGAITSFKSIEVGNLFPLGTKYSKAFDLLYTDENGEKHPVVMGSYGIGIGRLMGTIVEKFNDDRGIIWPHSVAPYRAHLIALDDLSNEADSVYEELTDHGLDVLYDDRVDRAAGEKFADADLIGIPYRVVISKKTIEKEGIEVKERGKNEIHIISMQDFFKMLV